MTTKSRPAIAIAVATAVALATLLPLTSQTAVAASTQPHGLAALSQLDQLPVLDAQERSGMESTYERNGGYTDWAGHLYDTATDRVYADLGGPGEITRIWATAVDPSDVIHIYFDGESTPRISMNALAFFNGTNAPFRSPLVSNDSQSSGGWTSYLPMMFSQSVRVALALRSGLQTYLQVNYQLFSPDTSVTTWTSSETGAQDSTAVRTEWSNRSADPKSTSGNTTVSGTVTIPSAGSSTLLDIAGPKSISSIKVQIPGITGASTQVTDDGRAFGSGGYSQWVAAISPSNSGVTLTRRLDYGVADQKANVFVDGTLAGTWFDQNAASGSIYDAYAHWKDSTFAIPAALTAGKSSITVKVVFVSSAIDWNEFTYWVRSTVSGSPVLTDTIDVDNAASESAHSYVISGATWAGGSKTFYYPFDAGIAGLLNQLSIQIYWDGSATAAVNAPLGSFFGIGQYGYSLAPKTLMMGIDGSGYLYLYFPMPFASHGKVVVSNSGAAVSGVNYQLQYKTQTGSFDNVGYFTTEYRSQSVTASNNHDVDLLNKDGQGTVVGLVASVKSAPGPYAVARSYPEGYASLGAYQVGYDGYIEGDEKFYVDGNLTPAWHGTGVEDFGNGGFGWNRGFVSTATHTFTSYAAQKVDATNWTSDLSYDRVMMEDKVNFNNHIRLSLEHGLVNDFGIDQLDTLVYYYYKPLVRSVLTDTVDVGVAASETAHSFATTGTVTSSTKTLEFSGDYRDVYDTDEGRSISGSSQFTVAINPSNQGVTLRNRFDQSQITQESQVYVDGTLVGTWRAIGESTNPGFKESDFYLPSSSTAGKSSITVKLVKTSASDPLSEFLIKAYSVLTGAGASLPPAPGATVNITNPDFEAGSLSGWTPTGSAFSNAQVVTTTSQSGVPFNQNGSYHFWGYGGGATDTPTGSMRTANFLLGGDGMVRFLMGGGNDIANLNLSLVRAADDRVLMSATGKNYEQYSTRVMDAHDWVGTQVYLKATDTATGGWGHVNLDYFRVPVSSFTSNLTGTWSTISGTWTDVAGGLQGTNGSDGFRLNSQVASNATIDADLKVTSTGAATIVFRSNAAATQFYAANIDQVNQRVLLWGPGVTGWSVPATIAVNTSYHLKVVASGTSLKVYFSGYMSGSTPIINVTDSTYSSGQVGVNVWNGTSVIQNLTIS